MKIFIPNLFIRFFTFFKNNNYRIYIKLFFLVTYFITSNNSAQVFLNNFGITDVVKTHFHYTKFTQLDFNNDDITDLFLYGNKEKSFVIHKGLKDSTFSKPSRKFFFYPIDDFKKFTKSKSGNDYYLFASRNKRLVGLVSFTKSYSLQLLNSIKFNSYPSKVKVVDLNKDGINEALIYGNNFNGIVKIENDRYFLNSEKLVEQGLFSDVEILDFNFDGLQDIITVDILNNSLKYFENNGEGIFVLSREIDKINNIYSLDKYNFNNDSFTDLVLGTELGMEILEGDSVYSFSKSWNLGNQRAIENVLFSNINNDKETDIIIPHYSEGKLEFLFDAKENSDNYNFFIDGLTDFQRNDGVYLALRRSGFLNIYSANKKWGKDFSFSVNGKLQNITHNNSDFNKIIYNDIDENSINVLEIDSDGNFSKTTKFQFFNYFSNFKYFDDLNLILGYEKNLRLLRFVDIEKSENHEDYFYTNNPIIQVNLNDDKTISILESNKEGFALEKIRKTEDEIESLENIFIDSSYQSIILNKSGEVLYWQNLDTNYVLNKFENGKSTKIFSFSNIDSVINSSTFIYPKNSKNNSILSIIFSDEEENIFLIENSLVNKYKFNIDKDDLALQKAKIKYSFLDNKELLFIYDKESLSFYIFAINRQNKTIEQKTIIEHINIIDYFVTNYFGKTYLVYTNSENNLITFKILSI